MEQKKLYLVKELRESYSLWITIFYGYEKKEVAYIGNDSIKVDCEVYLDKVIVDKEVNNNRFELDDIVNMTELKIAYNGKRVYHNAVEITKEQFDIIINKLEENSINYKKESWDKKMQQIKMCCNVDEFMEKYNLCIKIMNSSQLETYMYNSFLEAIDEFHNNMHKIAMKKNEKQCIFYVNGNIDEEKGMHIIREYIHPDGKKEKVNGWEYEMKEKIKIKLIPEGECYIALMDNQYIRTFNSNFEHYKNLLDAENYFKDYFKQNGYNNVKIKYEEDEYIMEGSIKKQQKELMNFETLKNKYGDFIVHDAISEVIQNGLSNYDDNNVKKSIESITLKERESKEELVDLYSLQYNTLILKCCNDLHNHFTTNEIMSMINNQLDIENTPKIYEKSFYDDNKFVTLKMEYTNNNQLIYVLDSMIDNILDNVLHQESIEELLEQMNINDYIDRYSIEDNEGHIYEDIDDYLESMEEEQELE